MQTSFDIILIRFIHVHTIRTVLNWQIVSDFRKYSIFVQKSQIPADRHIAALARRLVKKEILHRARVNIEGLTIVKKQEEDNYKKSRRWMNSGDLLMIGWTKSWKNS